MRFFARALITEHAFNALKTDDKTQQVTVLAALSPALAKRAGRAVTLRPGWDTGLRVLAMQQVLSAKFAPDEPLTRKLIATGDFYLVETNHWHDQFWGSCYCPEHEAIPGTNMLGELLMALRARLTAGSRLW